MIQQSLFGISIAQEEERSGAGHQDALQIPLEETIFTVIDLETTGLSAKKNAITEITAIQFQNGQEIGKLTTLVKPTEPIPPEVERLTGITNAMVSNAPAPVMALSELCHFIGQKSILVGHNVPFDIGFLREKLAANGLGSFLNRIEYERAFCTRVLAIKAFPGLRSYEGIVVATHCNVYNPNPHRAESDVRMSAGILFSIINRLQTAHPELKTLSDLMDYQGSLIPQADNKS